MKSLERVRDSIQSENVVLDTNYKFSLIKKLTYNEMIDYLGGNLCSDDYIFSNSSISLTPQEATNSRKSFLIARVTNLSFKKTTSFSTNEDTCVCDFMYNNVFIKT